MNTTIDRVLEVSLDQCICGNNQPMWLQYPATLRYWTWCTQCNRAGPADHDIRQAFLNWNSRIAEERSNQKYPRFIRTVIDRGA